MVRGGIIETMAAKEGGKSTAAAMRFEFGDNWTRFIKASLSESRVRIAQKHLLSFLGRDGLSGKTFLDIGCGSGLHSLAAFRAGAEQITSFDYDPKSVAATRICHEFALSPANWQIAQGSVLDPAFMNALAPADIVYSWGVLHHTGDVWSAIRRAAGRVAPSGSLYLALYSRDAKVDPSPEFWLEVKQRYNRASWLGKQRMVVWYLLRFAGPKDPRKIWRRLKEGKPVRGMSLLTDVRDWLGGWPMEYVWDKDVVDACSKVGLDHVRTATGEACHEYLFKRRS